MVILFPTLSNVHLGKKLRETPSHRVLYGHVKNGEETVDEVLLMLMRGPKTFTREDVVEFNCHGGPVVTKAVLKTLIANGARLAEPGEFTVWIGGSSLTENEAGFFLSDIS